MALPTYDNASSVSGSGVSALTIPAFTVAGSNRLIFVGVGSSAAPSVLTTSVVRNTTESFTEIYDEAGPGSATNLHHSGHYFIAPATGSHSIVVTYAGAQDELAAGAISLNGVDQTTPIGTHGVANGTASPATVTVPAAADSLLLCNVYAWSSNGVITAGADQTMRWEQEGLSGAVGAGGSHQPGTADDVMSWTFTTGVQWVIGAVPIISADAAPVIAYKSAGAGAGTETSAADLNLVCPAVVAANDILIAHVMHTGITTNPTTPSGWTLLYPNPADITVGAPVGTGTAVARHWAFGKLAAGTEDGATVSFGTGGGTNGRAGRIYSFSGYVSGTLADVVPAASFSDIATETDPSGPTVVTTVAGALAVALMCQDDNNTHTAITGNTGGTWFENVADYSDSVLGPQGLCLYFNSCTPTADPGTVTGGSAPGTDDEAGTIGFEIRPAAEGGEEEAVGTSAGAATVAGTGAATAQATGTAAGAAAAAGTGASTAAAAGTSAGAATVSGEGASTTPATGEAEGAAAVSGVGASTATAAGTAPGAATGTGVGASTAEAAGDTSGAAAVSGAGASTAAAEGTSAGAATVTGVGQATVPGVGAAAGAAAVSGTGAATAEAAGEAAGAATVSGVGTGTSGAAGAAAGAATVTGVGAGTAEAAGTSAGVATVAGAGDFREGSEASSAGAATVTGVGASVAAASGESAGAAAAAGESFVPTIFLPTGNPGAGSRSWYGRRVSRR